MTGDFQRGVIFDLDDTLYPRVRHVRSGFAAVARYAEHRFRLPAEKGLRTLLEAAAHDRGRELQALVRAAGLSMDIVPELLRVFRAHTPALWLFHDAEATLRQLRAEGWQLAVLTNGLPQVQSAKVEALSLRALVDHVLFAEEHAEGGKPHPAAFRAVLSRFGLPPHRVVMIGDDPARDVAGARSAGLRAIAIAREGSWAAPDADLVLRSLSSVPAAADAIVPRVIDRAA